MGDFRLKLCGLLKTRAHGGGVVYLVRQAMRKLPFAKPIQDKFDRHMDAYSNRSAIAFDRRYQTDTFVRSSLKAYEVGADLAWDWLYGPVNPDFFHEIMRRQKIPYRLFTFLDVGAGKGMGMMLAADYAFKRLIAVEFAQELVDAGKKNIQRYSETTGKLVDVEWVCQDFMQYTIPDEPIVIFFNNPFPEDISMQAVKHLQTWLASGERQAIVIYRKAPKAISNMLKSTPELRLHAWSPYWQAFSTRKLITS